MFTVDNYKVSFSHRQYHAWCNGHTDCFITYVDNPENHAAEGRAICSALDQFNKAVGRKVALTRALKPFDKEIRTRFWKAYWKAQGGVK